MRSKALPAVTLVIALAGFARYATVLRASDAIGLFTCGVLAGLSVMRLVMSARRPASPPRHIFP